MKSLLPWFVLILIFFLSLTIISCGDDKGEEYSAREEYSDDFPKIAEVRKSFFNRGHLAASSAFCVSALAHPDALVEVEAIAVLTDE